MTPSPDGKVVELLPGESISVGWKPGDLATWWHVDRGGYGFGRTVNVIVRKVGAKRVQIEVSTRLGTRLVWVSPAKLTHRQGDPHA